MRLSRFYLPTLKEAPADAEIVSHRLMIRAGMIRKLTSGVYNYLPYGWKAIRKVEEIIRREMDRAGSLELRLPAVQPADLWIESGRWEHYGKELLRFKDRHERDCCLGPTHEEVITDMVRGEVRSYRRLPLSLYQMQTKFRDEIRPRFGLMRGREFIMKDAYSFDKDDAGADESYRGMFEAYKRVFTRLALEYRAVEADSGSIGGSFSHEFMVLAGTGEDTIVSCTGCIYAANVERAQLPPILERDDTVPPEVEEVFTPAQHTVDDLAVFLNVEPKDIVKTLLLNVDGRAVAVLVRGDREMNEIKVKNLLKAETVRLALPDEVREWTGAEVGFAGPVHLKVETVLADFELEARQGWITGANKDDAHFRNVSLLRDVKNVRFADLRTAVAGDPCPRCKGELQSMRGIEVGHVFKLGTKYSEAMKAVFLDEAGKEQLMIMGCYGIGVTRVVAACIEQNHDDDGIIFPPPIAPFEVFLLNLDPGDAAVNAKAGELHDLLEKTGLDVLMDDREERPGVKFKDADLCGAPMQLVLGGKGLSRGVVEAKNRRTGEKAELSLENFAEHFAAWKKDVYAGWKMEG